MMMRIRILSPFVIALITIGLACGEDRPPASAANVDGGRDATLPDAPAVAPDGATFGRWSARKVLPIAKQELAVVALDDKIYVLGGFDADGRTLADVSIYDPKADTWSAAKPLPRPLHHVNAAAVGGRIWITGALEGPSFNATGDVFAYDPLTDTWTTKSPMPAGNRGASMVASVGAVIYVAGGFRDGAVAELSSYDTSQDLWTSLPQLATPRDHGVGAAIGTVFYAIGGRGGTIDSHVSRVDAFDTVTGMWSPRAAMPTSRGGAAAAISNGRIVVMGGEGALLPSGVFDNVEVYDPLTDTWSVLGPMANPRHGTGAAATADGVIIVPGGGDRRGLAAVDTNEALEL